MRATIATPKTRAAGGAVGANCGESWSGNSAKMISLVRSVCTAVAAKKAPPHPPHVTPGARYDAPHVGQGSPLTILPRRASTHRSSRAFVRNSHRVRSCFLLIHIDTFDTRASSPAPEVCADLVADAELRRAANDGTIAEEHRVSTPQRCVGIGAFKSGSGEVEERALSPDETACALRQPLPIRIDPRRRAAE